jgi:tripartite-type tricarboxylate transporter receptor subunit TctC
VQDNLVIQGAILVGDTPEAFAAYLRSEIAKWAKVAQKAGIKASGSDDPRPAQPE